MKNLKAINLVLKKGHQAQIIRKIGRTLSIISVIVLLVFMVIYIGSFSMLSYLSLRFKNNEAQISDLTGKINQRKDIEGIVYATAQKLKSIDEITSAQLHFPSILRELFSLPGSGIKVKTFSISPAGGVTMDMTASSSAQLADFVNLLTQKDEIENKYKSIQTSAIKRNKDGSLVLSINFNLSRDKFNE